ncbi:hypothetical protein VTK56DRAFT_143 [Thermocarpiscus australiensis]
MFNCVPCAAGTGLENRSRVSYSTTYSLTLKRVCMYGVDSRPHDQSRSLIQCSLKWFRLCYQTGPQLPLREVASLILRPLSQSSVRCSIATLDCSPSFDILLTWLEEAVVGRRKVVPEKEFFSWHMQLVGKGPIEYARRTVVRTAHGPFTTYRVDVRFSSPTTYVCDNYTRVR